MEFRQLMYFVQTVNEGSFTRAAEKMFISQPALSKMVRNFEREIGCELIHRGNNGMSLTGVGSMIYEKAGRLVNDYDELAMMVKNISKSEEGHIILGMPSVIGTCLISSILPGFNEIYPKINITLVEGGAKIIQEKVLSDSIDIGVVILPVNEEEAKIIPIITGEISCIVPKGHRLEAYERVKVEDLAGEKLLLLDDTFRLYHNTIVACQNAGFKPNVIRKSPNWDLLLELTGLKQGITIMPSPILKKFKSDKLSEIPIDDPLLVWRIVFIFKKNKIISNIEQKFVNYAIANARL